MSMIKKKSYIDMSKILEGFEGKWVALSLKDGQIVISGSGNSVEEAITKALHKGEEDPIVMKVPSEAMTYIV